MGNAGTEKWLWRWSRRVGKGILWALFALLAAAAVFMWLVPGWIGNQVLPKLAEEFGISNLHCEVRRLGLSGMDIAQMFVTDQNGRALAVNSIRVDYSLERTSGYLPGVMIDQVAITGLQLGVRVDENKRIAIDGLDWTRILERLGAASNQMDAGGGTEASAWNVPIRVKCVLLENIRFYLAYGDETLVVPGELRIDLAEGEVQLTGSLELRSGALDFVAVVDPATKRMALKVVGDLPLEHYSGLLPFDYHGNVQYETTVRMALDSAMPESVELTAAYSGGREWVKQATVELQFSGGADGGTLHGKGEAETDYGVVRAEWRDGVFSWRPDDGMRLTVKPEWAFSLPEGAPVSLAAALQGELALTASWSAEGWGIACSDGLIRVPSLLLPEKGVVSFADAWRWSGGVRQAPDGGMTATYDITVPAIHGAWERAELRIPAAHARGTERSCVWNFDDASVKIPELDLEASGIAFRFAYPEEPIEVRIGEVTLQQEPLASAVLTAMPDFAAHKVDFQCEVNAQSAVVEDLRVLSDGTWNWNGDWNVQTRVPAFKIAAGTDLSRWLKGAKVLLDGAFTARAEAQSKDGELSAWGNLVMRRVNLEMPDMQLQLKNMNLNMQFSDLLQLRTPSSQRLTAEMIAVGPLKLTNGVVRFKIDSPQQVNLEESAFEWCGGKVSTRYMRVMLGRPFYETTIHCENLNLSRVLSELGVAKATGTGTVWGQMPVTFSPRGLFFEPGYLYSIPGESAEIQVANADVLLEKMSPELAHSPTGELTAEALRNFQYSWARMNFSSDGEDFVIKLTFDGKPLDKLPFQRDIQTGEWMRTEISGGSIFQGIILDVNMRFPLNRLILLQQYLNQIWGDVAR